MRAEPKAKVNRGATRGGGSTVYYYIDYRRAIDGTKYRLHTLESQITKHSRPSTEKKPYQCPRCKSEFNQLELMDSVDNLGRGSGFLCKVCGQVIPPPARQGKGGDTMIGLFNKQFLPIINLLREIDSVVVPNISADQAIAAAIPVRKRNDGPQYQKTDFEIEDEQKIRPTAVKGIAPAVEKVEISITTDQQNNAVARVAEQERRAQIAAQNKVPEWYSKSTVSGEAVKMVQSNIDAPTSSVSTNGLASAGDEKKLDKEELETLDDFFKALKEQQEREQEQQEEEEEEDDDDDEDEFEDVNVTNGSNDGKRAVEDDSASNAASTPGTKRFKMDVSAATSAVGTPIGRSESDADDDEFEEVKM